MKKCQKRINNRLALVMKSMKYTLGKLLIISNNYPPLRKYEIEYYALISKIGVHHYTRRNVDLGTTCGKHYRLCCLSITNPNDSNIMRSMVSK
ncbi:hypothetical protein KP509_16G007800 [Ceratopteris richardii]|uniref:Ribosomal protein eL8/eL30/eS12/Gadd45 domain-containing protein n=1 Tax=Ceratopteris richardii TaxID=49495 RepID=A0A8T2SZE5_CERRI|nr:hypothetical protein KP509_16G007800 [Ceratopteris richardii]